MINYYVGSRRWSSGRPRLWIPELSFAAYSANQSERSFILMAPFIANYKYFMVSLGIVSCRKRCFANCHGYGKTLCYCCLPYVFDYLRLVDKQFIVLFVSPLAALTKDQVAVYSSKGLATAYVSAEPEYRDMRQGVLEGQYQIELVFISAESLFTGRSGEKNFIMWLNTHLIQFVIVPTYPSSRIPVLQLRYRHWTRPSVFREGQCEANHSPGLPLDQYNLRHAPR